jgi:predicted dithiol-disulfide oxidoreductase (DUF899 family)
MPDHRVVGHDEWIAARKKLLVEEKEFTRLRDALSQKRRELPWERVEKNYVFEGAGGKRSLADLFGGKSQLIIYHFMFSPEWDAGCKSCSFWADNFNGIDIHLAHRDTAFVAISRAPLVKLEAYKKRMGWTFEWLSSAGSDFNYDFGASFTPEQVKSGRAGYNYSDQKPWGEDVVGISVFYREKDGSLYHTYSTYSRGVDLVNGAYNYIDLTPKGRDEGGRTQFWVRRHDEYED